MFIKSSRKGRFRIVKRRIFGSHLEVVEVFSRVREITSLDTNETVRTENIEYRVVFLPSTLRGSAGVRMGGVEGTGLMRKREKQNRRGVRGLSGVGFVCERVEWGQGLCFCAESVRLKMNHFQPV